MNKILEHLNDPGWWFTALFVGIIASLLAAYLKDGLSKLIAQFSERYNKRRRRRRYKYLRHTLKVASDTKLILILAVRFLYQMLLSLGFALVSLCYLILMVVTQDRSLIPSMLVIVPIIMTTFTVYQAMRAAMQLDLVSKVRSKQIKVSDTISVM